MKKENKLKTISFYVSEEERDEIKRLVEECGCTQQEFIARRISDSMVTFYDELDELRMIKFWFEQAAERLHITSMNINKQLNLNQGLSKEETKEHIEYIKEIQAEADEVWEQLGLLLARS